MQGAWPQEDDERSPSPEELEARAAAMMVDIAARLAIQPPRIDDALFPESDRRHVDTILLMMNHLNSLIDRFATDLELLDYADAQQLGHPWSAVACRDAALALKDFKDALGYIHSATEACLRLRTPALLASIKAARQSFDSALPDVTGSRHIAAHSAEQIGTHDDHQRNILTHVPILMHMARNERRITSTRMGRAISFDMSNVTFDVLKSVRTLVFDAVRARQRVLSS
jgi:hypothetical protein